MVRPLLLLLLLLTLLALPLWGCHLIFTFNPDRADDAPLDGGDAATLDGPKRDLIPADANLDKGYPGGPVVGNLKGPLCIGAQQAAIFSVQVNDPAGGTVADQWSAPDGVFKSLGSGSARYTPPAAYAMLCPRTITFTATSSATNLKTKQTWSLHVARASDFNRDGVVDGTDYLIYQIELWSSCCVSGPNTCKADANDDCAVDVSDFNIWNAEQGMTGCTCP